MKLVALSKISSGSFTNSDSTPLISSEFSYETISMEIEDMLSKLAELNEKMGGLPTSSTAMVHTLTRHRDILHSYRTEFNKISQNHNIQVEREELLRGSGLMSNTSSSSLSRRDMYLKESQHLSK
jgi:golgi SNAP receptor complex member 1